MLQPTRQKYRKQHKGRNRGLALTGNKVSFGDFGLKATGRGRIVVENVRSLRSAAWSGRPVKTKGSDTAASTAHLITATMPADCRSGHYKTGPSLHRPIPVQETGCGARVRGVRWRKQGGGSTPH